MNFDELDVDTILEDAQTWVYTRLRHRDMVVSTTGTLTQGQTGFTKPSRFVGPRVLRLTGTAMQATVVLRTLRQIAESWTYDGTGGLAEGPPTQYHTEDDPFEFDYACDQAYDYKWYYYQRPALLSTATETNFLTELYPRVLRCACLGFANEELKDDSEQERWLLKAETEITRVHIENDKQRFTDAEIRMVPG